MGSHVANGLRGSGQACFDAIRLGVAYLGPLTQGYRVHCQPQEPSRRSAPSQRDPLESSGDSEPQAALEAEIPQVLFDGMRQFLSAHPEWTSHRVATSALATFLFQNGYSNACVNQHYISGLFMH